MAVQPSSVNSGWLLRFPLKFSVPNTGIRRAPKAGFVAKKQNDLAHGELRGCQMTARPVVVFDGVGIVWVWMWWAHGLLDYFAFISGERDLQEGSLSRRKLLLWRTLPEITIKVSVLWSPPPSHHPAATFLFIEPFPRTFL